jgi:hypothetical protein
LTWSRKARDSDINQLLVFQELDNCFSDAQDVFLVCLLTRVFSQKGEFQDVVARAFQRLCAEFRHRFMSVANAGRGSVPAGVQ